MADRQGLILGPEYQRVDSDWVSDDTSRDIGSSFLAASVLRASPAVQQSTHLIKTIHAAFGHQRERRSTSEQGIAVGQLDPAICKTRFSIKDVQGFVDAEYERNAHE